MRRPLTGAVALVGVLALTAVVRADNPEAEYGGKKVSRWIAEIRSPDPGTRETAIRAVAAIGKEARKAGHALINELGDSDASLRVNAVMAIGAVGLDSEDIESGVKALGRLLVNDTQHIVRFQCAITLGRLGHDARAAIPYLTSAVRDRYNSFDTRKVAAMALSTVAVDRQEGPDPKVIQALVAVARDDVCLRVRLEALTTLIVLGAPAKPEAVQGEKASLERLVRDQSQHKMVNLWARVVLMRIDKVSESHLIAIGHMLRASDALLRVDAANALGMVGPQAKSRVPDLAEALKDRDEAVVAAVISALALMGEEARPAIPALERVMEERNQGLRTMAKEAIDKINTTVAQPVKPAGKKP